MTSRLATRSIQFSPLLQCLSVSTYFTRIRRLFFPHSMDRSGDLSLPCHPLASHPHRNTMRVSHPAPSSILWFVSWTQERETHNLTKLTNMQTRSSIASQQKQHETLTQQTVPQTLSISLPDVAKSGGVP